MVDATREIGKAYDPAPIEDKWYAWWTARGLFHGEAGAEGEAFSIVIPPPNVTGSLHMGHALNNTLQDIVCRYKRMCGCNVLWLPGTDHAGIATQNVVERHLSQEGLSRHDIGREAFEQRVWAWKEQYGSRIIRQLQKLGASCDWRRERFTMDEGLSRAVREVFVKLYEKDLIYKGKYIINWCPRCNTALSDLEVEHEETPGKLYFVTYPFADEGREGDDASAGVTVATTRPETILGDVAIAVHPRDERNRHLIGRTVLVPLVDRPVPVIEDNMVDPEFGTGCVKITPAHDPNDFLVGLRHDLEQIQVVDDKGIMNDRAVKYAGLDRFEARAAVVRDLEAKNLLLRMEEHDHAVGHCYRCRTIIEPYLSEQWFVRAKPLAEAGVQAVKDGRIRWVPEQWASTYFQWMENIRDWCISRQLWWGHRIPAWTCGECGAILVANETPKKCGKCGGTQLTQEEDVLDTWFSSALWPFSTFGWPERTEELARYYPTSLLITGFDIIFFWVSRMIMMGLEFMDDVPFRDVYIHALVRDEQGQKMSKSKGNVIDPLDIIEQYGADSLRLTLAALTTQGRDIFLSASRIETYRFFLNKLWNASRFALMNLEDETPSSEKLGLLSLEKGTGLRFHDRWILSRTRETVVSTTRHLDGYFFGEAARGLYEFVWGELCDWYLEMAKPALRGEEGPERQRATREVLREVFHVTLRLLHPVIPFVTEELWHAFGFGETSIEQSHWPKPEHIPLHLDKDDDMTFFQDLVKNIRNLRAEARLSPQTVAPRVVLVVPEEKDRCFLASCEDLVRLLTRVETLSILGEAANLPRSLSAVLPEAVAHLVVSEFLDVDAEIARLAQELEKLDKDMATSTKKLSNESFLLRAPQDVVDKERARLAESENRKRRILENLASLR